MPNGKGTVSCLECKHSSFRRELPDSLEAAMICSFWDVVIPVKRYGTENLFCSKYESKEHHGGCSLKELNPVMKEGILYAVFYNDIGRPDLWREVYDLHSKQFTDSRAKEVSPIIHNGIKYSAPHFVFAHTPSEISKCSHVGGFIEARDVQSDKLLWNLEVYRPKYNRWKPPHEQDIFILSMKFEKNCLIVETEKKESYSIDITSQKIQKLDIQ